MDAASELTQIAYIEAKFGEDVASKVRMKTRSTPKPKPSDAALGPGIETRSAMKPKMESPLPTPAAKFVADVSAPKLERKDPTFEAPQQPTLSSRRSVAAAAPELSATTRRSNSMQTGVDAPKLTSNGRSRPKAPSAGSALVSRKSSALDIGGPALPVSGGGERGGEIAGAGSPTAPALNSRGRAPSGTYEAPNSGLSSSRRGTADLDIDAVPGPDGGGTGGTSGRRTILDYGSGGSGGLSGRGGKLQDAPRQPAPESSRNTDQSIAEAAPVEVGGKGSNMTISGQIAGRKILTSVPPEYSAAARKNGWEGVVAVHFTVLADGRVKDNVFFEQTSAHRDLNKAAMDAIREFRFAPLPAGQAAVEQWGIITIVFKLN
jgi:TonB family protein